MHRFLLAGLIALFPTLASAQSQSVRQFNPVTPGHAVMWTSNGVIQDAGTAASGKLTSFGTTASGPSICANSDVITAAGYQQICLGVTTADGATLSVQNYGTAIAKTLHFNINGTTTDFSSIPFTSANNTWSGIQSFNSGKFVLKGGTSGTLTVNAAAVAGTNTLTLPAGTTDFSATGGSNRFVKQTSAGGALTVAAILAADLPLGTNAAIGGVQCDGVTINCASGVITAIGAAAASIGVGTTTISSGTTGRVLYDNAGVLGEKTVTGTGSVVLDTSPTISGLTALSSFTATGLVLNASLGDMANATTKCRTTSGTGVPEDCTANQLAAIVNGSTTAWSTYTPTVSCGGGTLTSSTTLAGRYKFIGKTAVVQIRFTPNVVGSCNSFVVFSFPASGTVNATGADYVGSGANLSANTSILFFADTGAAGMLLFGTPVAANIYVGTIVYEII